METTQTIKLEVNVEEANVILVALSKLPYEAVAPLITKLQMQAQEQLTPKNE